MKRKMIFAHAKWCTPCKYTMNHLIADVQAECSEQIEFVDADDAPSRLMKMGVTAVPTVLLLEDDVIQHRFTGVFPHADSIVDWLKGGELHDSD